MTNLNHIFRAMLVLLMSIVSINMIAQKSNTLTFEHVAVPDSLRTPTARANFVALHYWDLFAFNDTTYIHSPQVTEQAFANYVGLAAFASPSVAQQGINLLLKRADADSRMFEYFNSLFEKYLYEPNSPLCNEELYIPVLQYLIASPHTDKLTRQTYQFRLKMALKNRKGTKATDLKFEDRDGKVQRLHDIFNDRKVLLIFFDPNCDHCVDVINKLKADPFVMTMTGDGTLAVVAIYADGKKDVWNEHKSELPINWTVGYDKSGVYKHTLYDLKAMPTLFVLDKDKTVLIKDGKLQQVQSFLRE